jgi:hypothetical protein
LRIDCALYQLATVAYGIAEFKALSLDTIAFCSIVLIKYLDYDTISSLTERTKQNSNVSFVQQFAVRLCVCTLQLCAFMLLLYCRGEHPFCFLNTREK